MNDDIYNKRNEPYHSLRSLTSRRDYSHIIREEPIISKNKPMETISITRRSTMK